VLRSPSDFWLFLYGREKIGKTTFLSSYPDSIFFATEPGVRGLPVYEFNEAGGGVYDWGVFLAGVAALEAEPGRFRTVIIDTADRAYDMALDYVCRKRDIEYPGQDSDGREDFGKSWRAVKDEFTAAIARIAATGRTVVFTSHAKTETVKTRSGVSYDRVFPTLSGQGRKVLEPMVDFFWIAEYLRDTSGTTRRVVITQGDEFLWAGSRAIGGAAVPRYLPLLAEGGYDMLCQAFAGEDVGIDPADIMPGVFSKTAIESNVRAAKVEAEAARRAGASGA